MNIMKITSEDSYCKKLLEHTTSHPEKISTNEQYTIMRLTPEELVNPNLKTHALTVLVKVDIIFTNKDDIEYISTLKKLSPRLNLGLYSLLSQDTENLITQLNEQKQCIYCCFIEGEITETVKKYIESKKTINFPIYQGTQLCSNLKMRYLIPVIDLDDLMKLYSILSTGCDSNMNHLDLARNSANNNKHILVAVLPESNKIVGTVSILIENKYVKQ